MNQSAIRHPYVIALAEYNEQTGWTGNDEAFYVLAVSHDLTEQQKITVKFADADSPRKYVMTVEASSNDPLDTPPYYSDHLDLACAVWRFLIAVQAEEGHEFLSYLFNDDQGNAVTLQMSAPDPVEVF